MASWHKASVLCPVQNHEQWWNVKGQGEGRVAQGEAGGTETYGKWGLRGSLPAGCEAKAKGSPPQKPAWAVTEKGRKCTQAPEIKPALASPQKGSILLRLAPLICYLILFCFTLSASCFSFISPFFTYLWEGRIPFMPVGRDGRNAETVFSFFFLKARPIEV